MTDFFSSSYSSAAPHELASQSLSSSHKSQFPQNLDQWHKLSSLLPEPVVVQELDSLDTSEVLKATQSVDFPLPPLNIPFPSVSSSMKKKSSFSSSKQQFTSSWKLLDEQQDALETKQEAQARFLTHKLIEKHRLSYYKLKPFRDYKPSLESYAFAMEWYSAFSKRSLEYAYDNKQDKLFLNKYLTIADYDKSALFIIDVENHQVVDAHHLFYAKKSQKIDSSSQASLSSLYPDPSRTTIVDKFENDFEKPKGTYVSNLWFMTPCQCRLNSWKRWEWLFLAGLEDGVNASAFKRGIAIHLADSYTGGCLWYAMPLDKKKRPAMLPSSIKRMLFNYPLNEKTKQPIKHLVDVKNMHVHSSQEVSREYGSSLVFAYTQQRAVDYVAQSSFCQDLLQQYHYRDNYNYSQDTYRLSSSRISHRS